MFESLRMVLIYPLSLLRPQHELAMEILALRHQITVLKRRTHGPKLHPWNRCPWMLLKRVWPNWRIPLMIFRPETVIGWQRAGFGMFWRWRFCARRGRPTADRELIGLVRQMWSSNPTWGSKRIQAELANLGIALSDSTVRKDRPRTQRGDQTWKTFPHNHAKAMVTLCLATASSLVQGHELG